MNAENFKTINPADLTDRADRLAYDCGKVMERIGKFSMWLDWLEEEDDYVTNTKREDFWEKKCKEAWAAEAVFNMTPEERVGHAQKIRDLRKRVQDLTYEAHCASVVYWEQLEQDSEFCAEEALYWTQVKEALEWKVAGVKQEVARRRAVVEAAAPSAAAAGGGAAVVPEGAEFKHLDTDQLRAEMEATDEERKQLARFTRGRAFDPAEVKEAAAMDDWLDRARAELMRRQGLVRTATGTWVPKGVVHYDAEGKPVRPPMLRTYTDPTMHNLDGRADQWAANMRAYMEATGEQSPVTRGGCPGCAEDQPNQMAHMDAGGCLAVGEE